MMLLNVEKGTLQGAAVASPKRKETAAKQRRRMAATIVSFTDLGSGKHLSYSCHDRPSSLTTMSSEASSSPTTYPETEKYPGRSGKTPP